MKRLGLKVDSKGRIQIPKALREELRIGDEVSVEIEGGEMRIEPAARIFERLSADVRVNFKSVTEDLPRLRKAAEEELFKQLP